MLQSTSRLSGLVFDRKRYAKSMRRNGERLLRRAAKAWLRAAIPKVPVATGMALAGLRPLGRLLDQPISISPTRKGWAGHTISDGESQSNATLSIRANASGPTVFSFEWETTISHFELLEDTSNPKGGNPPWKAIKAGNAAFNAVMKKGIKELPNLGDFVFLKAKK